MDESERDSVNLFLKDTNANNCPFCKGGTISIAGKCGIDTVDENGKMSNSSYFLLYIIKCNSCSLSSLLPPSHVKNHLEINNKKAAESIKI